MYLVELDCMSFEFVIWHGPRGAFLQLAAAGACARVRSRRHTWSQELDECSTVPSQESWMPFRLLLSHARKPGYGDGLMRCQVGIRTSENPLIKTNCARAGSRAMICVTEILPWPLESSKKQATQVTTPRGRRHLREAL